MSKSNEWTPKDISRYKRAIKASHKIKIIRAKKRERWLNNFIDGKPVEQFVWPDKREDGEDEQVK